MVINKSRVNSYSKSKEYAQRAYELEKVEKYKNLVDELNNN